MCGIAGIVDLEGTRPIDTDALARMTYALRRRGPDGQGYAIAPGVGFGHRRLIVIDAEGGAQPFHSASRKGALTYNGEIYNFRELGRELTADGVALRTRSDVEALAEGLAIYGTSFIEKLRGMFAFGYWNDADATLILCRDRLGERPLYYATTQDGLLLFASEIGALVASGLIETDIDLEAAADYLFYGFVPDPKSIYRRIRKLPPAHMLLAPRGGQPRLARYWSPRFDATSSPAYDDAREELIERLDACVSAQMLSDVPLGAFLSGGVDSSAVVASMAKVSANVKTCSVGFDATAYDERVHARAVSELFRTEHYEDVASVDAVSLIDETADVFGEPFADSSAIPAYLVSAIARRHVTVALSGDGGDEIFAGYRRYPFFCAEENLRGAFTPGLRKSVFGSAGAIWPKLDWAPRPLRWKTTLLSLAQSRAEAYARAVAANVPEEMAAVRSADFSSALDAYDPVSVIAQAMPQDGHPLLAAQQADLAVWLPGRMLTKVDRTSMAHGLEVRPPLLDHTLVEWAGGLAPSFKLSGGTGKRVLKDALRSRLPDDILYRRKQGFSPPLSQWLSLRDGPLDRLKSSQRWRNCGLFDAAAVMSMIERHERGVANLAQELWTLAMYDAFLTSAERARNAALSPPDSA